MKPKAHMLQARASYACGRSICGHPDLSSNDASFCLKVKIQYARADLKKIPTSSHFITNLMYRLKPHLTRNQCLRARLDTCSDANIMPAIVYKLVFNDPNLKKTCSYYPGDWNLHQRYCEEYWIMCFHLVNPDTNKVH